MKSSIKTILVILGLLFLFGSSQAQSQKAIFKSLTTAIEADQLDSLVANQLLDQFALTKWTSQAKKNEWYQTISAYYFDNQTYERIASLAEPLIAESEQLSIDNPETYAQFVMAIGAFYENNSKWEVSLDYYRKAYDFAIGNKVIINNENFGIWQSLADNEMAMGNYNKSFEILERGIESLNEQGLAEERAAMELKTSLFFTNANIGQFDIALSLLDEVLPFWKGLEWEEPASFFGYSVSKIFVYSALGKFEEGKQTFKEIDAYLEVHPELKKTNEYFEYLVMVLNLYSKKKEFPAMEYYIVQMDEIVAQKQVTNQMHISNYYFFKYIFERERDDFETAAYCLEQTKKLTKEVSGVWSEDYLSTSFILLEFLSETSQLEKCEALAPKLVDLSQKWLDAQYPSWNESDQLAYIKRWRWRLNLMQKMVYQYPQSEAILKAGLNMSLMEKGLILNHKKNLLDRLKTTQDTTVARGFEEWIDLNEYLNRQYALVPSERAADFDEQVIKMSNLERKLSNKSYALESLRQDKSYRAIQEKLGEKEVVLEFVRFSNPDCKRKTQNCRNALYGAYVIRKAGAPEFQYLFDQDSLTRLKARRLLYSHSTEDKNLHMLLYQPLKKYLDGQKMIYLSNVGLLHQVNFGAIPYDENTTLADYYKIRQVGSSREILTQNKSDYPNVNAVVFGGIDFTIDTTSLEDVSLVIDETSLSESTRGLRKDAWTELPHTNAEAKTLERLLKKNNYQVNVLSKENASEEAFKQLGTNNDSPRILHIATHGYFFPRAKENAKTGFESSNHPLIRSGLILAGANHVWQGRAPIAGKEDGILTAYEIAQMDLSNTELVVLSACETGLGDLEGNEGVYGLQRAFKMAGVKYVMMSLWSVQDKQTKEFMELFYSKWLDNNKSIPEAHLAAQNAMRLRYAKPFNPNLWAGFVLAE